MVGLGTLRLEIGAVWLIHPNFFARRRLLYPIGRVHQTTIHGLIDEVVDIHFNIIVVPLHQITILDGPR